MQLFGTARWGHFKSSEFQRPKEGFVLLNQREDGTYRSYWGRHIKPLEPGMDPGWKKLLREEDQVEPVGAALTFVNISISQCFRANMTWHGCRTQLRYVLFSAVWPSAVSLSAQ